MVLTTDRVLRMLEIRLNPKILYKKFLIRKMTPTIVHRLQMPRIHLVSWILMLSDSQSIKMRRMRLDNLAQGKTMYDVLFMGGSRQYIIKS